MKNFGAIVASYAHVEFLLGDLCMKAWYTAEYSHLREKFPYRLQARIRSARDLFSSDGPLGRYASEVEGVFERLATYEDYRHFMAHGLCIVTPTAMPMIQLRLWRPTKEGAEEGTIDLTIEQMRENATEITAYCNQVIRLLHKVYTEQNSKFRPMHSRRR